MKTLVAVGVLVWLLNGTDVMGWHRAKYTDSAHGNGAIGVKRKSGSSTEGYARGNCAHCHEQHGSIGGNTAGPFPFALFAPNNPDSQDDNFCFQCHREAGSVQQGGVTNYTYSTNFGGGVPTFTSIYDAFNPSSGFTPSSHDLFDVHNHAANNIAGFTSDTNACIACHDPHTAQKNYDPVAIDPVCGGVNTAIRRPADYDTRRPNLWGDETPASSCPESFPGSFNERMFDFTNRYQAPFFKNGSPSLFEPANDTISDGSNVPNYRLFCMGPCHGRSNVYSTERSRNLVELDWGASGDWHGLGHNDFSGLGTKVPPYGDEDFNYVLSCMDCHEPHGSQNEWLLRTCVNGKDPINVTGPGKWLNFCTACHDVNPHQFPWDEDTNCGGAPCHGHGLLF
jgi:hypothetical protein